MIAGNSGGCRGCRGCSIQGKICTNHSHGNGEMWVDVEYLGGRINGAWEHTGHELRAKEVNGGTEM